MVKVPCADAMKALIDALPFYVFIVDEAHRIVVANDKACLAAGMPIDSMCGAFCPKVMHGLEGPIPGCPLEEAVALGTSVSRELHDPARGRWMNTGVFPFALSGSEALKKLTG